MSKVFLAFAVNSKDTITGFDRESLKFVTVSRVLDYDDLFLNLLDVVELSTEDCREDALNFVANSLQSVGARGFIVHNLKL